MTRKRMPETRKAQLLDAARLLFRTKGFEATNVSDIVAEAGVAQGTFYNYFGTKEEAYLALLDESGASRRAELDAAAAAPGKNAVEKLGELARLGLRMREADPLFDHLHRKENASLHALHTLEGLGSLASSFERIVRQGLGEGSFVTAFPEECALCAAICVRLLVDQSVFPCGDEELERRKRALGEEIVPRLLGAAGAPAGRDRTANSERRGPSGPRQ
jgi:AcrR family transcriptional regulator